VSPARRRSVALDEAYTTLVAVIRREAAVDTDLILVTADELYGG
jgi:hypothetical protein